ncbi:MAG TPA: glycerate kinase [Caldithrix abyssi]|uniref:Glycerate kinase n=1 Tax=Caldithrix abyssi TaxID=187145 RepID=A0A7V1LNI2_CALAY|nr:glycerate kinase [Caldithrix abyssi]
MKVLVAPDKFKGSLTARQVCKAVEEGLLAVLPGVEIIRLPLADGGEGSLDVLWEPLSLKRIELTVRDPLLRPVRAYYGMAGESAYIEMAVASGLQLLTAGERDPLKTSTYGTGELIADALRKGAGEIYLFAGGSATNDAGLGMAAALGFRFTDSRGRELPPVGASLQRLEHIRPPSRGGAENVRFTLLGDVTNPLYGKKGAAFVYAAQKGAGAATVERLDRGLRRFARVTEKMCGRRVAAMPGSGAAGGLGAAAMIFLNAEIHSGVERILEWSRFNEQLRQSDVVISGEGRLDEQTLKGKVVHGVAARCRSYNKPLFLLCGQSRLGKEALRERLGARLCKTLADESVKEEEAMRDAYALLVRRAGVLGKVLK